MGFVDVALDDATSAVEVPTWEDLSGWLADVRAESTGVGEGGRTSGAAAAWEVAARLPRLFRLGSPDAPGLAFVGGTVDPAAYGLGVFPPASVSGRGLELRSSALGCIGEAVEALSRLQWGGEPLVLGECSTPPSMRPETARALQAGLEDGARHAYLPASRLGDEAETVVPAALCLTMAGEERARPSGSGCAAGPSRDHARLSALLELVERDAAALWWRGGRPARPLSAEVMSLVGGTTSSMRRHTTGRRTWFLDITTDLDVPCIAAVSVGRDGRGFACGVAARVEIAEAAEAAFEELCQMELANRLVQLKLRQRGPDGLAPVEKRQSLRMGIDCEAAPIVLPQGLPGESLGVKRATGSAAQRLGEVVDKLARHGVECFCVDLTRDAIGVPAVRVLAPMLQGLTGPVRSARLDRMVTHPSARAEYVLDVELM